MKAIYGSTLYSGPKTVLRNSAKYMSTAVSTDSHPAEERH